MARPRKNTASDQAINNELVTTVELGKLVRSEAMQTEKTRKRGRNAAREERSGYEEEDEQPLVRNNQKKGKAAPSKHSEVCPGTSSQLRPRKAKKDVPWVQKEKGIIIQERRTLNESPIKGFSRNGKEKVGAEQEDSDSVDSESDEHNRMEFVHDIFSRMPKTRECFPGIKDEELIFLTKCDNSETFVSRYAEKRYSDLNRRPFSEVWVPVFSDFNLPKIGNFSILERWCKVQRWDKFFSKVRNMNQFCEPLIRLIFANAWFTEENNEVALHSVIFQKEIKITSKIINLAMNMKDSGAVVNDLSRLDERKYGVLGVKKRKEEELSVHLRLMSLLILKCIMGKKSKGLGEMGWAVLGLVVSEEPINFGRLIMEIWKGCLRKRRKSIVHPELMYFMLDFMKIKIDGSTLTDVTCHDFGRGMVKSVKKGQHQFKEKMEQKISGTSGNQKVNMLELVIQRLNEMISALNQSGYNFDPLSLETGKLDLVIHRMNEMMRALNQSGFNFDLLETQEAESIATEAEKITNEHDMPEYEAQNISIEFHQATEQVASEDNIITSAFEENQAALKNAKEAGFTNTPQVDSNRLGFAMFKPSALESLSFIKPHRNN